MENNNNEIFGFGNNTNEGLEQATNFNYDSISGLGESDYENEDLFSTEVETNNISSFDNYNEEPINTLEGINDFGLDYVESNDLTSPVTSAVESINQNIFEQEFEPQVNIPEVFNPVESNEKSDYENENLVENNDDYFGDSVQENPNFDVFEPQSEEPKMNFDPMTGQPIVENFEQSVPPVGPGLPENVEPQLEEYPVEENNEEVVEQPIVETFEQSVPPVGPGLSEYLEIEDQPVLSGEPIVQDQPEVTNIVEEETIEPEEQEEIFISETPIEELNKLTEYEEDKIEETDINTLFDKVSVNVKDASDIFRKNTNLKQKIDTRFDELKKLQSELENSRKKQLDEINKYKEEVLDKLTEKKEEIERRLNILKESQVNLEKEKKEFEEYKKKEQENIDRVQKEVQSAYDDRREELNHIEDVLRKQKDALDEERSQLSLDRIQYESDKNELANNLLKFNEIVNSFTNGVNDIKE